MTSQKGSLESEAELSDQLETLLVSAHDSGIDVKGAFECRNGDGYPDWDVVITEIEKNEQAE